MGEGFVEADWMSRVKWRRALGGTVMDAGNTIKGEITIAKAPSAKKGRSKLQAVCAGGR